MMDHQPILSSSDARLSGEREALGRREGITRRPDARPGDGQRPRVAGRFLSVGDDKLYVRGVTYGTFMPSVAGDDGYDPTRVDEDFARMVASGINAKTEMFARTPASVISPGVAATSRRSAASVVTSSRKRSS